jgi:hypothetical protein
MTTEQTARHWIELRHPVTNRLIGKYCPQTMQLEVIDKGRDKTPQRGLITLPNK